VKIYADVHVHLDGSDAQITEILSVIKKIQTKVDTMTEASAREDAAIAGIQGDIDGLKAAAQVQLDATAALQVALDAALANQGQVVADAVAAAVADAQAAADAAASDVASRLEAIDAQTPGAVVDPPAPPVDVPPVEPPPVEPPVEQPPV
jgi:hypothetical protein